MTKVEIRAEERLRRPKVNGLRERGHRLPHGEGLAPVYETNILLISVRPHIPVCRFDQLAREMSWGRLGARIRGRDRLPAQGHKEVLLAVQCDTAGECDVPKRDVW